MPVIIIDNYQVEISEAEYNALHAEWEAAVAFDPNTPPFDIWVRPRLGGQG